jgi:hypothetical protein
MLERESGVGDVEQVTNVQHRLLELGYTGTGEVDGKLGWSTQGAILNFRNRNGLPLTPTIDDELIAALLIAAPIERPLRVATATITEIAPKVEAVQKTWFAKMLAWLLTIPSVIASLLLGIVENLGDAVETLSPLKLFLSEFFSSVPPLTMILVIAGAVAVVASLLLWQARRAETALVDGYKRGTVRNDNVQQKALESA